MKLPIILTACFVFCSNSLAQEKSMNALNGFKYLFVPELREGNGVEDRFGIAAIVSEQFAKAGLKVIRKQEELKATPELERCAIGYCEIIYDELAVSNKVELLLYSCLYETVFVLEGNCNPYLYLVKRQALRRSTRKALRTLNQLTYRFNENSSSILNEKFKEDGIIVDKQKEAVFEDSTIRIIEMLPVFPGGNAKLGTYLNRNISVPAKISRNWRGTQVNVSFITDKDGFVQVLSISPEALDEDFKQHVHQVYENMPKWRPGIQAGKAVTVKWSLPFTIR